MLGEGAARDAGSVVVSGEFAPGGAGSLRGEPTEVIVDAATEQGIAAMATDDRSDALLSCGAGGAVQQEVAEQEERTAGGWTAIGTIGKRPGAFGGYGDVRQSGRGCDEIAGRAFVGFWGGGVGEAVGSKQRAGWALAVEIAGEGGDAGGVDAAAEEERRGWLSFDAVAGGSGEELTELGGELVRRVVGGWDWRGPEASCLRGGASDSEEVAGGQAEDALVVGPVWAGDSGKRSEESRLVHSPRDAGHGEDLCDFAGDEDAGGFDAVVEGAHAEGVAGGDELLSGGVPKGEGEVADEPRGGVEVPAAVGREDQLGVGAGGVDCELSGEIVVIIEAGVSGDEYAVIVAGGDGRAGGAGADQGAGVGAAGGGVAEAAG